MIQVNRNTQHITEYTPYYIIYARERSYYTHTRKQKKEKGKDNNQRQIKD